MKSLYLISTQMPKAHLLSFFCDHFMILLKIFLHDPGADTAENMNRLVLLSGRMPEAPDECVVHVMGYGDPVPLRLYQGCTQHDTALQRN